MKNFFLILFICFHLSITAQIDTFHLNGNIYELAFSDEFNGSNLDANKWIYRTDCKHWSDQLEKNVRVKDGFLILDLKKERSKHQDYTGGGIISKETFKYGYYESRLKLPPGAGWHTSFWLLRYMAPVKHQANKTIIEIDILENDSKNQYGYDLAFHLWKKEQDELWGNHISTRKLSNRYIVLACEYTPDYIKYYLNDKELCTFSIAKLNKIELNIWLTSIASHLGDTKMVNDDLLPIQAMFDYVKFYKLVKNDKY